jgi:hypothetical protein
MKNLIFVSILSTMMVLVVSCSNSGHKSQSWHPHSGKPMKKGANNK